MILQRDCDSYLMNKFKRQKFYSYIFGFIIIFNVSLLLASMISLVNNYKISDTTTLYRRNPEADILLRQGLEYLGEAQNSNAEKVLKQAIIINPNLAEAFNNLGIVYYRQSSYRQAIHSFKEALSINPSYHVAYYNLAWLLYNHQYYAEWYDMIQEKHNYKDSNLPPEYSFALIASVFNNHDVAQITKEFRNIVRQKPEDSKSHLNLGLILEIRGNIKEAISEYKKALKIDPKLSLVNYRLGQIYRNMGKNRKAIYHLQKAQLLYAKSNKPYGFWRSKQLISLLENDSRLEDLIEFNSARLLKTDFLEDRQKLSKNEINELVSPAITCITSYPQSDGKTRLKLLPVNMMENMMGCRAGINLTGDGYILTNAHNVSESDRVAVTFKNGQRFLGQVLDRGSYLDLALIKLDQASNLPKVTWASRKLEENRNSDSELNLVDSDVVYAVGFRPNEPWQIRQSKILKMSIMGLYKRPKISSFITPKGFVTFGYSGGPLINSYGQVIGITFSKSRKTGEGRHLSVNTVKEFIDRIILTERIRRDFNEKYN